MIRFTVPGDVRAKDRPRIVRIGQLSRLANTPETVEYEKRVAAIATLAMGDREPYDCPMSMRLTARFTPPASASKKVRVEMLLGHHAPSRRDADNIAKIIGDALNGIVYRDDCLIVDLVARKVYAESAGADVFIAPHVPPHPRNWSLSQEAVL